MDAVDLALVLAVDGSASVTYDEFNLICRRDGGGTARTGGHPRPDGRAGEGQHGRAAAVVRNRGARGDGRLDPHRIGDRRGSVRAGGGGHAAFSATR